MRRLSAVTLCALVLVSGAPAPAPAQENRATINAARLPQEAGAVGEFVPRGWEVEEEAAGDLNGDAVADVAVTLVQASRGKETDEMEERQRALVILFRGADGRLRRAAVAGRLLQCTKCGGAFYGIAQAPVEVKVERGVLVVSQSHGSRNVVEQTFRFRYDPAAKKFLLIGYDKSDHDRATGEQVEESTNFLTGVRTVKRTRYDERTDRDVVKSDTRTRVARRPVTIEQVDYEAY